MIKPIPTGYKLFKNNVYGVKQDIIVVITYITYIIYSTYITYITYNTYSNYSTYSTCYYLQYLQYLHYLHYLQYLHYLSTYITYNTYSNYSTCYYLHYLQYLPYNTYITYNTYIIYNTYSTYILTLLTVLTFSTTEHLVTLTIRGDEVVPVCILHTAHTAYAVPPPVWIAGLIQTASMAGTTDRRKTRLLCRRSRSGEDWCIICILCTLTRADASFVYFV